MNMFVVIDVAIIVVAVAIFVLEFTTARSTENLLKIPSFLSIFYVFLANEKN